VLSAEPVRRDVLLSNSKAGLLHKGSHMRAPVAAAVTVSVTECMFALHQPLAV
jgi:hypothetical protein